MDISGLSTVDSANEGKWFQVELYGKKQDFSLLIYGVDSDIVTQYTREQMKKLDLMSSLTGGTKQFSEDEIDELLSSNEAVAIRIGGIKTISKPEEPVVLKGRTLKNDLDSYLYLLNEIPALKPFVNSKSNERKNFLSDTKERSKKQ